MLIINIAKDFSNIPGGRYKNEGKFSGEEFREDVLKPKYFEAKQNCEHLLVDLDGSYGYPTSFLDEAFGGLARELNEEDIFSVIILKCEDEPTLIEDIKLYSKSRG